MAKFITLTLRSGHPIRVNSELMTSYAADVASFSEQRGSYVSMYEPYTDPAKYDFAVTETPEQIDALLGVTADPAQGAAQKTDGESSLDASDEALLARGYAI